MKKTFVLFMLLLGLASGLKAQYFVTSIGYSPYPYNTGTAVLANVDDMWSGIIPIPFSFNFFGTVYNELVISGNCVVSLGTINANNYTAWALTASCPDPAIVSGSTGPYIFAPFQDADPALGGEIYYETYGTAPNRAFVISFNAIPMFSCTTLLSTSQIVLHESTNDIDINIENKPDCPSWNSGNGVLGIQDAAGTLGYTPPGRNTGQWTAAYESWHFSTQQIPPSTIYASIITSYANCFDNGSATVTAFGGYPPYSYLWSDPLSQTTATASGLAPGLYSVSITDTASNNLLIYAYIQGICLNTIKGRIYIDTDQDCVQDSGELGVINKVVYASPGYYCGSTDSLGDFTIFTPNMSNTLSAPYNMNLPYQLVCPSLGTYTVNFNQLGDTSLANDFSYFANPNYFDLGIQPGWSSGNPGFNKSYWVPYNNVSLDTQNVVINFVYDTLLQYTSSTQGGVHYPAQHKVEWTINNVPPGYSLYWFSPNKPQADFYIPTSVNINDVLHSYFEILPISGDAFPSNNTFINDDIVQNCSDPNSKSVSPRGEGPDGQITQNDSILLYTIHFQNTGNDTAFTVIIVDTLSPYLDAASVIPGAATHPYTFDITGQGVLTFRFDHIMLPDSNVNEPASNGYVNYTIKLLPNIPDGSVIYNTASIYFDFNPSVNTNTVMNTFYSTLTGIENSISLNDNIIIYPNPANDKLTVAGNANNLDAIISIYNLEGEILLRKAMQKAITSIDISGLASGMYFVKVNNEKEIRVKKFIKE